MQTEANQQLYISSSLTTRARAEAWRRERLLAGAPAPKPLPCPANAQMQAEAWRFMRLILLAIAGWILFGALRPEPTHSMSMEPAPTAAHSRLDWYYSDSPTD
jgi:hypothetical protein